jgi:hypothetical protein
MDGEGCVWVKVSQGHMNAPHSKNEKAITTKT